jgi:adenosine deaminase
MDWLEAVPKVELHIHLEGAIPLAAMWELIQKYGGDPSVPTMEDLSRRFEYRSFTEFIQTWSWKNRFLREYEDFAFIARAVAQDLHRQHIVYAEMFFSPSLFARHGLEVQRVTQAVRDGLSREPGARVALVADLVRDYGPAREMATLQRLAEVRELGVVGIGIGGSEHLFPPEAFRDVYEAARQAGFHTTAHAGEGAGPSSIWSALRELRVERIGHGTRAGEDESLLAYLVEHQVPLEVCPLSNVRTGVVRSFREHPVRDYYQRGILVTVNTDDPQMFRNSLAEEYRLLVEERGFSSQDVQTLILNAARASWLSPEERDRLAVSLRGDPAWSGRPD